ncbi:putative ATP-dependent helicase DinG [Planococcus massiliensis]|uniref:Putative ATP-dependent helicase DinG n=1 Tax=Planococcus massiliensis TaxID=1499687 RepID=A0A098ELF9_9BACL|nr:ATP-dependent DNA helicase [Planococcus massiliensis]CEG22647.1 putative ATP-dependent helicase DinG [Planococcus massiliensis]
MRQPIPFPLSKEKTFFESLNDWIGDIFYDELPDKGFDLRDEQIFMAFQIEQALKEKSVLFAEAGVGTGKTLAYLLPAIAYARYTGKPALISCADETLIEQLVKKGGDIDRLNSLFDLKMDVRLAKSRDQYLCLQRLEGAQKRSDADFLDDIEFSLPEFVNKTYSMQNTYPYGERSSYPEVTDEEWQQVNYHPIQNCAACELRNKCGQTIHRNHYRQATDLVICSHDFLMEHIWTKETRVREGQTPLLPETSLIVLDEGHLLEFAAQRALTYEVQEMTLLNVTERIMVDGVREKTLNMIERTIDLHNEFFRELRNCAIPSDEDRQGIRKTALLLSLGKELIALIDDLMEEFVFESELYTIPEYDLKIAEEYFELYTFSMRLFVEEGDAVNWLEVKDEIETLVIMPRLVTDILDEKLFDGKTPIIFSSATLSVQKDFTYIADSLGIDDFQSFSVPSPFEYEEVMKIVKHPLQQEDKFERVYDLFSSGDQTLVLFKSKIDMEQFKQSLPLSHQYAIEFEGDRELSTVVKEFQEGKFQVLCSYHLWEGLDLPGEALTKVIIVDLPFPPKDPVFEAKRNFSSNPLEEIDLPFMQLRIQQGIGRLIRTSNDYGEIHLLLNEEELAVEHLWQGILPVPAENF